MPPGNPQSLKPRPPSPRTCWKLARLVGMYSKSNHVVPACCNEEEEDEEEEEDGSKPSMPTVSK